MVRLVTPIALFGLLVFGVEGAAFTKTGKVVFVATQPNLTTAIFTAYLIWQARQEYLDLGKQRVR